jgi:A/G-specific adenine glycosylase
MPTRRPDVDSFARRLLHWFDRHGRHDLPWQLAATPYAVWISEIMLQQTQVATVIAYFERFMRRFPSVAALAAAELDEVLAQWAGLGYYARGRNLHCAAKQMVAEHGGALPQTQALLEALPGIGRSTAAAILALAHDLPAPILDGNVKRVLARYHGIEGWPGQTAVLARLWQHAAEHTPRNRPAAYTQAIMDLGAILCTRHAPGCARCPVRRGCVAAREGTQDRLPSPRPRAADRGRRSPDSSRAAASGGHLGRSVQPAGACRRARSPRLVSRASACPGRRATEPAVDRPRVHSFRSRDRAAVAQAGRGIEQGHGSSRLALV